MKKSILLTIFFFLLFPHIAYAGFTSLNASTPNPIVGEEFYVQFNIDYLNIDGTDLGIKDFNACILFDASQIEYVSVEWHTTAVPLDTSTPGKICFNREPSTFNWSAKISPFKLKFKTLKAGNIQLKTNHNGSQSHYADGAPIAQSYSGVTVNAVNPDSNTAIGSLVVRGYTINPTFSKTHYQYYLTVAPEVSSIYVDAQPSNKKQTIKGAGQINLNFGLNVVHVVVHAQDGSTREYTINVTRTDNRTGDTTLKVLNVSDTTIKYEEGKTYYEAIVSRSVESVLIDARPNDTNATLLGTGRKVLEIGENTFELTLQTKKNDVPIEKVYTIKIIRSNEELEKVIQSSKLVSLNINNLVVNITDENNIIYTGVYDSSSSIYLDPKPESQTANVEITGNENLEVGFNNITITVTENNDEKTEYHMVVYKNPSATSINNLNFIASTNDNMEFNTDAKSTNKITTSQLRYLSNNKYKLYYNAVDLYSALLYQVVIDNPKPDEDIEVSFIKQEEGSQTYKTTLKEGYEMTVFVGDTYPSDQPIKIYTYNEDGKYKLLTDGVKVQNGYVNFKTNGDENYIFTNMSLINNEGPVTAFINKYKMYLLGGIGGLVILILLIRLMKKQNAIKKKNEPLY